jgi:hypothetical protein
MNYSSANKAEHFTESEQTQKEEETFQAELDDKEKELFEDLKENRLSNEQISELVSGGVLTERLIEKFLNQLNVTPEDGKETTTSSTATKPTTTTTTSSNEEEFTIEGFSANQSMFAKF